MYVFDIFQKLIEENLGFLILWKPEDDGRVR